MTVAQKAADDTLEADAWAGSLAECVDELKGIDLERRTLLERRLSLIIVGFQAGFDSQVGLADRTGLSRGRIQQLLARSNS